MLSSKVFFPISLATALLIVSAAPSPAQFSHIGNNTMANSPVKADSLTPEEARAIALEAYLYGYPLVTTEITGLAFTNTVEPNPKTLQAPLNQLVNQPAYPPADYKGVTAPNADTETPPVDGFWSITMYDDQFYFYPNPLNKLTLSPRNNLQYNADGSLDLYFAHQQPPNVPPSNWLPAPKENFILMMRLYWPKEKAPSILPTNNPTWTPPPIERLN